ncbi:hypothetical protein D3C77_733360 [compost metagenome]
MAVDRFVLLQEADAVLGHEDAALVEAACATFIERRGKQAFTGADRIGTVRNNHVELFVALVDEIDAIVDHQLEAGIVIGPGVVIR